MADLKIDLYLWCFLAGLLGIAFHLFAIKVPSMKKRANVANEKFDFKQYIKDDLAAVIASMLTVLIFLVILDEVLHVKPSVRPYLKFAFVFVGYTGSSILVSILGTAQKKIDSVVNEKTDKADGKK